MNKKCKVAMAVAFVTTSIAYSIGGLFAQSEETISENTPIVTTDENIVTEVLENQESVQNVDEAVGDIEINEINFPDPIFREHIRTGSWTNTVGQSIRLIDQNKDGILSSSERNYANGTMFPPREQEMKSLQGIEYFPNLMRLRCNSTGITSLDVSKNLKLEFLDFSYTTGITSIDLSNNTALTHLDCSNTGITSIDLSNNTALDVLRCYNTGITELDLSNNTALTNLECSNTGITSIDLSNNTALTNLNCYNTGITSIDLSNNTALTNLNCRNTGITSIDLSNNTALTNLDCSNTGIIGLDLSMNTNLKVLSIRNTRLGWMKVNSQYKISMGTTSVTINVGGVDNTFNIQEVLPGIDPTKISFLMGGRLDKTTGIMSGYTFGTPITYSYDCGYNNGSKLSLSYQLNFKEKSYITINDDLNKVYDGKEVVEPGVSTAGSTGIVNFEWYVVDGTPLPSAPVNAGSYKVKAILAEDRNYGSAESETSFEITKASSTIDIHDDLNKVHDGTAVVNPINITTTGSTGVVSFEWYTANGTKLQTAPTDAGSYKVKAILAGDTNYAGAEVEKTFEITKAISTIIIHDDLNKVYDGIAIAEPTNITTTGSTGSINVEWYEASGTKLQTAPTDAGSYKIKAILAGDTNYAGAEVEKEFTISQATSNIVITVELNKIYDGQPVVEPQITVTGSTGTITYEWYKKEESTTRVVAWTKLATAPSGVGSYKVVITVAGDANFTITTVEKEFSILDKATIKPEIVPTPGTGGSIINPDGTEGLVVNPDDKVESNGPVITNPDGSITFPNGGTIIKPDGSVVIIQLGATLKPDNLPVEGQGVTTIPGQVTGVQTGDGTQVGLWTMFVGLSTGMMMFFRRKNRKEEV